VMYVALRRETALSLDISDTSDKFNPLNQKTCPHRGFGEDSR
jgi:hypothetical protein